MGDFGRLTSVDDLPSRARLKDLVKQAMRLNEEGVARTPRRTAAKKTVRVPADLRAALSKNNRAAERFAAFSPSHRREYVEWITEARTDTTRARRLATTVEWLEAGKSRNWKYMKR